MTEELKNQLRVLKEDLSTLRTDLGTIENMVEDIEEEMRLESLVADKVSDALDLLEQWQAKGDPVSPRLEFETENFLREAR